jgi:hypothetical protein
MPDVSDTWHRDMKVSRYCLSPLLLLLVQFTAVAAGPTNSAHRENLLRSATSNRVPISAAVRLGLIPTNTPAFSAYVLDYLIAHASNTAARLKLDVPQPITSDRVTLLRVIPKTNVWYGAITVLDRFQFGAYDGVSYGFTDLRYAWDTLDRDISRQAQLARTPTRMTTNDALKLASIAVAKLGLANRPGRFATKPECSQYEYLPPGQQHSKPLPLPLFQVRWPTAHRSHLSHLEMQVSALNTNIVSLRIYTRSPAPLPTNYFTLLGISNNPDAMGNQNSNAIDPK